MWKIREIVALTLLVVLVGFLVYRTDQKKSVESATPPVLEVGVRSPTMPEMIFYAQARLLVGAKVYFDDAQETLSKSGGLPAETKTTIDETLRSSLISIRRSSEKAIVGDSPTEQEARRYLARKQMVIAHFLSIPADVEGATPLESNERSVRERELDDVLQRVLAEEGRTVESPTEAASENAESSTEEGAGAQSPEASAAPESALSSEDAITLREGLGWFADLILLEGEERVQFLSGAKKAFTGFLTGLFVMFGALGVGFITLIAIFVQFRRGRTRWKFEPTEIQPALCLETFLLYMAAMSAMAYVMLWLMPRGLGEMLGARYGAAAPLAANAFGILATLVMVIWPLFWRTSLRTLGHSFGLYTESFRTFFRDLALAPMTYLAAIIPLLLTMFAYAISLDKLGIDVSRGAHPVIPMLLGEGNAHLIGWVFFLAVVVAPIVEEVFFRGALYSYARARIGRWSSIFLTSVLFAAIHPQGLVGIVPLTAIGCVLAFLREWRNSLVAPIIAHACFNGMTLYLVTKIFLP